MLKKMPFSPHISFEDAFVTNHVDAIFKAKRGYLFCLPPPGSSVILMFSGGLDSVCLWDLLLEKYQLHVFPLYFTHPMSHRMGQEQSIHFFESYFKKKYSDYFHPVFTAKQTFLFSFMTGRETRLQQSLLRYKKINQVKDNLSTIAHNLVYNKERNEYVFNQIRTPSRLGRYAFAAFEYLLKLKYHHGVTVSTILAGIVPEDGHLVRESTRSALRSVNLSLCAITGDYHLQFSAPVEKKAGFYYTKDDLVRHAVANGVPIDKSWSCNVYNKGKHCGDRCSNCSQRKRLLQKYKVNDTTVYASDLQNPLSTKIVQFVKKQLMRMFRSVDVTHLSKRKQKLIPNRPISISSEIAWDALGDEVYLLNKRTGYLTTLNTSASVLWAYIAAKPCTMNELLIFMIKKYRMNKKMLKTDMETFLREQFAYGYLTYATDTIAKLAKAE